LKKIVCLGLFVLPNNLGDIIYVWKKFISAQQFGNSQNANVQKDLGNFFSKTFEKFRIVLEFKTDLENHKGW
jgi:hypothetical protein